MPHTTPWNRWSDSGADWCTTGAASDDGTLLISLTRQDDDGGWAMVRLPDGPLVLDALGSNPGEPEFVGDVAGRDVVCGVTAGEYELWVVCARLE